MNCFPSRNVFIEGPDCSGKTTLIKNLHRETGYRWHITDRCQISRSIFNNLYRRDIKRADDDLHLELFDLNNRFIVLLPPASSIVERFLSRGDELHDINSLRDVYHAFVSFVKKIENLPNVLVVKSAIDEMTLTKVCIEFLNRVESASIPEVGDAIVRSVAASPEHEIFPLQFSIYDNGDFISASSDILSYEPESEYYLSIMNSLMEKIDNELKGKNEYNRVEDLSSRRFVYSDNTCISFIQASNRKEQMDFHAVIRSSDVENIFKYDLKFLYYLASLCWNKIGINCKSARMRININSAHFVK